MSEARRYQHYEILKQQDDTLWVLSRSPMGVTYRAYDTNLYRPVALKIINSAFLESEPARQRFLRQARAVAWLRHPNVASYFELGRHDHGNYYRAMELSTGRLSIRLLNEKAAWILRKRSVSLQAIASAAIERLDNRVQNGIVGAREHRGSFANRTILALSCLHPLGAGTGQTKSRASAKSLTISNSSFRPRSST